MNAIISGRAGLAVMTEGIHSRTLYVDEAGEIFERHIPDPAGLLRDVEDLELFRNVTPSQVRDQLAFARRREDAFHMVLILLSDRSSQTVREEAADVLNELLNDDGQTQASVERTLYVVPLPPSANVDAAIAACEKASSERSMAMISELIARQPYIADVRQEWDILASSFATTDEFLGFQAVLVWEGFFRELVENLASDRDLSHFVFHALSNERVIEQRNHRAVISKWVAKWRAGKGKTPTPATITPDEMESDDSDWTDSIARRPKAEEALARVCRQKVFIVQTLRQNRIGSAQRYIHDLIRYQEKVSDSEHICKSLCDLATEARDMGLHDLQFELLNRALEYKSDDVIAQSQRADALKALNRLPEALDAYKQAIAQHPQDVVAKAGYAEVLKALNRLPEALDAYKQAIAQHPQEVVPKNGYAEVLKVLNRLPEALDAYKQAMAQHPQDVVARSGAACVLAAMGYSEQALSLLPQSEPVTQEDWIAYHIRGMIHLRRGEVSKAIQVFENGVEHNPRPTSREYFRTALAVAYLRQREYQHAASVLEQVTTAMLQPCANILRLHAFGARGDCERTAEIYEHLPKNPEPALAELQQELQRRYVLFATPEHDESWVFDREVDCILLAA